MLNYVQKKIKVKGSPSLEGFKKRTLFLLMDNTNSVSHLKKSFGTYASLISEAISVSPFKGEWLQSFSFILPISAKTGKEEFMNLVLLGTGDKSSYPLGRARQLGLKVAEKCKELKTNDIIIVSLSKHLSLTTKEKTPCWKQFKIGLSLGFYKYLKIGNPEVTSQEKETLLVDIIGLDKATLKELDSQEPIERSLGLCRSLQDTPPNIAFSDFISKEIIKLCGKHKNIHAKVFKRKDLEKMGMDALLAVGQGSAHDVQLLVLEYKPKKHKKTLSLVGKGITMDTGGYSLKTPSTNQEGMKYDMSGAAVVLSSLLAIAELEIPLHVYAVTPLCENMVDALAYRVSDVISSYSKKTIEVKNTDAEGRLVLSDALFYAATDLKSDYIVDFATLTGAMITTFGHVGAGIFAFDDGLKTTVEQALEETGERGAFLPVWEEVVDEIRGDISDLCNIGKTRGAAGSMLAAGFLNEFVNNKPYVHIDIAGVADSNQAIGSPSRSGSGYGVQLSVKIAELLSKH